MTDLSPDTSPDALVAIEIVESLLDTKLLPERMADSLRTQLSEGALKAEDWRLLAEKALELELREQPNEPQ